MDKENLINKEEVKKLSGKVFTKSNFKKLGICLVLCGVIAGGGGYYAHQQKITHRAAVNEARISLATVQAAAKNQTLLPESQVRSIVAQAIGQEEKDIVFREISLKSSHDYYDDDDHDRDHDHKKHRNDRVRPASNNTNNEQGTDADTHATNKGQDKVNTTSTVTNSSKTSLRTDNPIYKVKCAVGSVKYKVFVNAINGDVLRSEID